MTVAEPIRTTVGRPLAMTFLSVGTVLLGVSGVIARSGEVPAWEARIFHLINDLPDTIETPMWLLQLSGLLYVPAALGLVVVLRRHWTLGLALILVAPVKLAFERAVIKQLVERQRPGTSVCDGDLRCANFRDAPIDGLSFVSGHAMITAAMAVIIVLHASRRRSERSAATAVLVGLMVLANGVARIYLGAHNPLDIVGGVGAGMMMGVAIDVLAVAVVGRIATARGRSRSG